MNWLEISGALEMGLIYALVAIGVYITFRLIDFPDLTVDGSFTLGGALAAILLVKGLSPFLATLMASCGGIIAGTLTGYLHTRWRILGILASILVMTGLYSVNLRLMGQPNITLLNEVSLFSYAPALAIVSAIALLSLGILVWFFSTHYGLSMRATSMNTAICHAYGIPSNRLKTVALALSNGIVALSGAIFAQAQGFADISMGTGTIIMGLAAVILGESLLSPRIIVSALIACIIGSILYRIAIVFALNTQSIGLLPSDLNLVTTLLVIGTLILPRIK